jgi:hypothetical protein
MKRATVHAPLQGNAMDTAKRDGYGFLPFMNAYGTRRIMRTVAGYMVNGSTLRSNPDIGGKSVCGVAGRQIQKEFIKKKSRAPRHGFLKSMRSGVN